MVRYVTAVYVGGADTVYPFKKNQQYPLAVKKHWWSKRITVYQRRGYYEAMQDGTLHSFDNWQLFENCWEVKEVEA